MTRSRLITIIFSASIALNLFFLGAIAARSLHPHPPHLQNHGRWADMQKGARASDQRAPVDVHGPKRMMRDLVSVMGGRQDPRIRAIFRDHRQEMKVRREEMNHLQEELTAAMCAEPFSKEALSAVLDQLNRHTLLAQADAQQATIELASQLSPKERAELKKLMTKRRDSQKKLR